MSDSSPNIGVLALQGAFAEHVRVFGQLGIKVTEVRRAEQLALLDGLVIPGGESTAIGLIAGRWNLVEPLRTWIKAEKPVWGTCAGMILLAKHVEGQKAGGQSLLGGMDISVDRNYFGRQIDSFQAGLETVQALKRAEPCKAIFIRAPVITAIGPEVQPLAILGAVDGERLIVAAQQHNMLVTAFHPELSQDTRWHQFFIEMVHSLDSKAPDNLDK